MRLRLGPRQGPGQKNPAAHARKADAVPDAGEFQEQMVARIPSRGEAGREMFRRKLPAQADYFKPRPVPEAVFILERRPRRDERHHPHLRPETALQIESVGLGEQGDVETFRRGAQQGRGDDQVAQAPQFHDEQFRFQGGRASDVLFGKFLSWQHRQQPGPLRDSHRRLDGCHGGFPHQAADAAVQADA